jgi:hypothetical protein
MSLTASSLRDGLSVALHCVKVGVPGFFLQGRPDGTVFPTREMTERGTQWILHQTANPGVFRFECQAISLLLEGRASECRVRVAAGSSEGMNWRVRDFPNPDLGGFDHVSLQCQAQGGRCSLGFLDVIDEKGVVFETDAVGLVPESSFGTAAHWEMILLPVGSEPGGGPGNDPGGKPQ